MNRLRALWQNLRLSHKLAFLSLVVTAIGVLVAVVPLFEEKEQPASSSQVSQTIGDITINGDGNSVAPQVNSQPAPDPDKLVTASSSEEVYECGTQLFVPGGDAEGIANGSTTTPADWNEFRRRFDAIVAGETVAEASIQGESARTITLTGVEFDVKRASVPDGLVFSNPCGDSLNARRLEVDLDSDPPRIVKSVRDQPDPELEARGRSVEKPIEFPWTVSIDDPLLLMIVATTKRSLVTWSARIAWRSGEKSGELTIDNDGRGFRVVPLPAQTKWFVAGGEVEGRRTWRSLSP